MFEITVNEENGESTVKEINAGLKNFNDENAGPLNSSKVILSVKNENDKVIAGLIGDAYWNAIFIDVIWVNEKYRKKGYGTALIKKVETIALEQNCDFCHLTTFSFQAPEFYEKLGYKLVAELNGIPKGSSQIWLSKKLK